MVLGREITERILDSQNLLLCAEDFLTLRSMVHCSVIGLRLRQHRRNTAQDVFVEFIHI